MQHYAVIFTPRAERQLTSLYGYIADQSGDARADSFVGNIVADCLSLSTFPQRGTKRDDIRPNLAHHKLRPARDNRFLCQYQQRYRYDPWRVLWRTEFRARV